MTAKSLSNLIILLFTAAFASAATRLVPDQYPNIQAAINDCNDGDTVIVAPGTYTGDGNRDISYKGKAITLRSTDPNDPDTVAATIIDCNGTESDPHRGFVFHTYEKESSVLSGLTITNGFADDGGGIYCQNSNPTITHCTIAQCTAWLGGGVFCEYDSAAIIHCTLTGNHANDGAGIFLHDSTCVIGNCLILGNFASSYAGGIRSVYSDPLITNCVIAYNSAKGIKPTYAKGGGLYFKGGTSVITNCTITNNSADLRGGGILMNGTLTITNSIIRYNTATNSPNIYGSPAISYSNVQGGLPGVGNINADPLFIDLGDGDYHLSDDSPCIDAGDPAYSPPPSQTDIDGDPRLFGGRVDMGADETLNDALAIAVFPNVIRFNILEGQANLPEGTIQIWNTGLGALNWRITEDCLWLQVNPQAGTSTNEPNQVALTVDTTALHWGTYNCQLTVSDPCAINNPRTVDVLLDLIGPQIELSTAKIEFSAYQSDLELSQQTFTIRNKAGGLLSWQAGTDCDWLDLTPTAATSRGEADEITLTADVSGLPWGHFDCNLTVSDPNASNSPVTLPVSLDLVGPFLSLSSNRFDFQAGKENPTPPDQVLTIQNIGGGTLNWQITAPNDCNWISVYPLTGPSTGQVNEVTLSVDAAGLEYGSYSCQLLVSDANAQQGLGAIQVNLTLRPPVIAVEPTIFQFHAWQADPCLFERTVSIQNTGGDTLNWEISVPNGCSWLSIHPLSGRSAGDVNNVALTVDTTSLADGFYDCEVTITDPNAPNSPQTVKVRLHLGLEQGRLYVPSEYPNIQSAIDWALPGDVVVIAPAIYTGPGNRDISFLGKPITVRSIDPNDPQVVASTVIDCNAGPGDHHRGFNFRSGEDANSILAGLTITNGYANEGAAILCTKIGRGRPGEPATGPLTCRVLNCIITRNMATRRGGGISIYMSSPTIANCTITANSASYGGGIYSQESDAVITNCIITHNTARHTGGGISIYMSSPTISNCTFTGNSGGRGTGAIAGLDSSSTVTNCIFWHNRPWEIYAGDSLPTVAYCNVQGGWPGIGNIDVDPLFVSPGYWDTNGTDNDPDDDFWVDGDYHLKSEGWRWDTERKMWIWDEVTSRCIDAGDPGSPLGDESLSVPADPNNDWGVNVRINMGAYGGTAEASIPPHGWTIRTDYNNDGIVNFTDFACWSKNDAHIPTEPHGHLNPDPIDLALLADRWLGQTTWFGTLPPPTAAWNPDPFDGATGVRTTPVLSWQPGFGAVSHDVYFGTANPPAFQRNQIETTFNPGTLNEYTTYDWRIDEVNIHTTTPGILWSFTTTHGGGTR